MTARRRHAACRGGIVVVRGEQLYCLRCHIAVFERDLEAR